MARTSNTSSHSFRTTGSEQKWLRGATGVARKNRDPGGETSRRKEAEAALEKRRVFQEAVLDCIADGIVACDRGGTLTYFNRATRELHGLPLEPIEPEEWARHYDLYEPDGKTPLTRERIPLFRALKGEDVSAQEMVIAGTLPRSIRSCLRGDLLL
jgi:PAS domain-containing protein